MQKHLQLIICAAIAISLHTTAKEPIAVDFTVTSKWRGEIIKLPPRFAPEMKTTGVEEIRFAPGMFKADQADFFSYILVITSTTGQTFGDKFLHQELLTYYKGLAKAVSKGAIDPSDFTLKLDRAKKTPTGVKAAHTGTLEWVEPFATQKAQSLHFDIQTTVHNDREYLFICVSPQKIDHAIWKDLYAIRSTFRVKPTPSPAK